MENLDEKAFTRIVTTKEQHPPWTGRLRKVIKTEMRIPIMSKGGIITAFAMKTIPVSLKKVVLAGMVQGLVCR